MVVLEARARLGGRAWFREIPGTGVMAEYGASWFFLDAQPALAAEIERYGLPVTSSMSTTRYAWLVDGVLRIGDDAARSISRAAGAQGLLDDALARIAGALDTDRGLDDVADLDVPVSTWIATVGPPPETAAFVGVHRRDGRRGTASGLDARRAGRRRRERLPFDDVLGGSGESLTEGTSGLAEAIGADAAADVRLSSPVVRVRQHTGGISIDIAGGGEVRALAAILALPLHVWVDVSFDPPPPEAKRRAAISGHAGASTKVLAIADGVPEGSSGWGGRPTCRASSAGPRCPAAGW